MDLSHTVGELEVFHATPRRREPTVSLTDVCIYSARKPNTTVDLFDAIFKGPFTAIGTYKASRWSSMKSKVPTPCRLRVEGIEIFSIEKDDQVDPPSVKIWFKGTVAWYEIATATAEYEPIFQDMKRRASIWEWVQDKRVENRKNPAKRPAWPTLNMLTHDMPAHLDFGDDPMNKYHAFLIERIIQSHHIGDLEPHSSGVDLKWMECQLARDLEAKYPAIWRSIYDRNNATENQEPQAPKALPEPMSPKSLRAKVQRPSKETGHLQQLCIINADQIKETSDVAEASDALIESMDLSDPWQSLTPFEVLEKFEGHAETLLSDPTFTNALEGWPGLRELKSFTENKWWKHRPRLYQRHKRRLGRQRSQESSTQPQSLDAVSFDMSHEDLSMELETPAAAIHTKKGRKGTSSLRPRQSLLSHTPGTPTRQKDNDSDGGLINVDEILSDDEIQLIELPKDLSLDLKPKSANNKRLSGEYPASNASKRLRKTRNEAASENRSNAPPQALSFKFGRGRPPLTTVPIQLSNSSRHTTTFRCPFPQCNYVRTCAGSAASKAEIDKHHLLHRSEIRDAMDMLKDPFIVGGRVGGDKGNRLVRPIGGIEHIVERIEEMAKELGATPSKQMIMS